MTVEELRALLNDVLDDSAEVVIKDHTGPENYSSYVKEARYERKIVSLVQDKNEETKAEYAEQVVLVI